MRNIILLIYIMAMVCNLNSQETTASFITDILKEKDENFKKYNKIVSGVLENESSEHYTNANKYIIIQEFFSTREAAKLCENGEVQKDSILSYFDVKSSEFGEAYICYDSALLGAIYRSPAAKNKYNIYKSDSSGINYKSGVIKMIIAIEPDLVFSMYNLPRTYWIIKEKELFVVSYEYKNSRIENLKKYNIDDYIKNILKNEDIAFLTNKRVFVVSGK